MEDVLDLYQQAYAPSHPVVCFDEGSQSLIGETRVPRPMAPGQPPRTQSQSGVCQVAVTTQDARIKLRKLYPSL